MQVKFKTKEKGEQPKLFTQLPHRYKHFTKHPLEKHAKGAFFLHFLYKYAIIYKNVFEGSKK